MKMENPDEKMYKMTDVTQRSIDINKPHFDSLEVANAISKREQSVLTAAALKYSKMKGIKDPQDEIEALKAENETHKKAYWDLLESWSDLRVKYSIAVNELAELKAKLDKAKWQPIESAPRDGTPVDLWMAATNEYDAYLIPNCSYDVDDELWFEGELVEVDGTPTHWMPLPDAPEQR